MMKGKKKNNKAAQLSNATVVEDFNTAEFQVLQGCQSAAGYGDVAEPSLMAEGVGHGVTMTPACRKRIKHF